MPVSNKTIESLFRPINNDVVLNPNPRISPNPFPFKKGNLITFSYTFWKHDPYPLLIISPPPKQPEVVFGVGKLWGLNLHRLTFNDMRSLLNKSKSPNFSYSNSIKNFTNLKGAYRSYKWSGVRQVKVLNYEFLLNVISTIRSFDPAEVQIIRKNVQEQIKQQINPKSYEVKAKTLDSNKENSQNGIVPTIKTVPTVPTVPTVQNNMETT